MNIASLRAVSRWIRRRLRRAVVAIVTTCGVAAALWIRLGPVAPELLDVSDADSTVVVDRHGVPLYEALYRKAVADRPRPASARPATA